MITINNQSWIFIHVYVVEGRKWLLILFNIIVSCWRFPCWQFNKGNCGIITLTWWSFKVWLDFEAYMFWSKWCDDVLGSKTRVTMQLKEKHVPFLLGVHCATHRTNLNMQTLSWLSLVAKIEALFQVVYNYYAQNWK